MKKLFLKTLLNPATLLNKRLWHRCFPVDFAKSLRTPFLQPLPPLPPSATVSDYGHVIENDLLVQQKKYLKMAEKLNIICYIFKMHFDAK